MSAIAEMKRKLAEAAAAGEWRVEREEGSCDGPSRVCHPLWTGTDFGACLLSSSTDAAKASKPTAGGEAATGSAPKKLDMGKLGGGKQTGRPDRRDEGRVLHSECCLPLPLAISTHHRV